MGRNFKDAVLVLEAAGTAALTFTMLGCETIALNRVSEKCFSKGKDTNLKMGLIGVGALAVYLPLVIVTFNRGMSSASKPIIDLSCTLPKDTTE